MRFLIAWLFVLVLACAGLVFLPGRMERVEARPTLARTLVGFDRNDYPGDAGLPVLRKSFAFTSYWLSPPPGAKSNSWAGKRRVLESQGFGFLLLYRGRTSNEIRTNKMATDMGLADARDAAVAAIREGFAEDSVIFLDEEEGGRYSPSQHLYLHSWAEELEKKHFRPGIYCSGIMVDEGGGATVITANDIREHIGVSDVVFWVYNDACPPSPGCVAPKNLVPPSASGVAYAAVWQYVRSPREKKVARHCSGYATDGNCYAPEDTKHQWYLDMNVATTANPSGPPGETLPP
jgi:hypothetical protein